MSVPQPAGYSGTPLAKKLGFKPGFKIILINAPDHYLNLFTDLPENLTIRYAAEPAANVVHLFVKEKETFFPQLMALKACIKPNGMIWVSWPKKASKVITDITEDVIRNFALGNDLVDVKVCAVDEVWSGLKLVVPVALR